VQVVWWDASGARRSRAFGTAFRVGPRGELLTAWHVAASARTERERLGPRTRARIQVAFAPCDPERGRDADGSCPVDVAIVAEDRDADLALLRMRIVPPPEGGPTRGVPLGRPARLATARPPFESAVAVAGYPIEERDLVVRPGRLLDPAALVRDPRRSESLPDWLDDLLSDDAILLADVEVRLGNSGAPVYLVESGEVVGLCSAILLRNAIVRDRLIPLPHPPSDPIALIVAAHRIQSFLDAHRASAR
jgi:S1-C subfamily serine protease